MPPLGAGIHVFLQKIKDVDGRDISAFKRVFRRAMPGHDARTLEVIQSCLSNDVGGELILDVGNSVAQDELALLEALDLQQIGARRVLQSGDRGIEVAVLLLQARQLLPQLAFFVFGHRHR